MRSEFTAIELRCGPARARRYKRLRNRLLGVLGRKRQAESRNHAATGHVETARVLRIRQIYSLAMLAAVDLGIGPVHLLHIATGLLQHVGHVVPALQVPAAELALFVLFITGALQVFFELYLVVGQRANEVRCLFSCHLGGCQRRQTSIQRQQTAAANQCRTQHSNLTLPQEEAERECSYSRPLRKSDPAERIAPRRRRGRLAANRASVKPSIWRTNSAP